APDSPNPPEAPPTPQGGGEADASSRQPQPEEPKPLERITAADRSRADIAARFKEKRAAAGGQVEFHGDMRDPSQTYGPFVPAPEQTSDDGDRRSEEQPPAQTPPQTTEAPPREQPPPSPVLSPPSSEAQPRLMKVKVHGREAWLPEGEVIAEAQKSLAAGNLLESAKEVLAGARGQMSDVGDQHPSSDPDPYVALAQTLQLEDADAAGSRLRAAIESETAKARQEAAREAARNVRV